MRQPCALRVARDLEDPRTEVPAARRLARKARKQLQKLRHALVFERGAEAAGENFPRGDQRRKRVIAQPAALQKLLQRRLVRKRGCLVTLVLRRAEIDAGTEALQSFEQQRAVRAREVHLIDEKEGRHAVTL